MLAHYAHIVEAVPGRVDMDSNNDGDSDDMSLIIATPKTPWIGITRGYETSPESLMSLESRHMIDADSDDDVDYISEDGEQYADAMFIIGGIGCLFDITEEDNSPKVCEIRFDFVAPTLATRLMDQGILQNKYNCSLSYDEESFALLATCTDIRRRSHLTRLLNNEITRLRLVVSKEKESWVLPGNVRVIFTAGYKVERVLFTVDVDDTDEDAEQDDADNEPLDNSYDEEDYDDDDVASTTMCCGVCMSDIGEPSYMMSACQHGGCRSCFEMQFLSANNKEFVETPIQCALCSTVDSYMALQDIRSLASVTGIDTIKRCALTKYLREHPTVGVNCPNVGKCEHILDCRTFKKCDEGDIHSQEVNGGIVVTKCDQCDAEYCLTCCDKMGKVVSVHKGESCEEYRLSSLGIRHWINVLLECCTFKCPHCGNAVYDFTGCCAVECNCKRYICGICIAGCSDSNSCHDHVKSCSYNVNPGNYSNDENQLRAAHRLRRIQLLKVAVDSIPSNVKVQVLAKVQSHLSTLNISLSDIQ